MRPFFGHFLFFTAALYPSFATPSSMLTLTHVIGVGVYGDGSVWVILDKNTDQYGCANGSLEVAASNPVAKTVLAIATAAYTSKETIVVQVDSCLNGAGTFSGARNGTAFGLRTY